MKRRCVVALGGFAALAAALPLRAAAELRVAFVIGNGAYRDVPLRNPVNDARAVEQALGGLGFRVQTLRDATWREMIEGVKAFIERSASADVRLIYYAGHGAQVRGRNYLIPVDAPMDDSDELTARSLDAREILERLGREPKGLNLLILDACRNNPANRWQLLPDGRRVRARGAPKGLLAMEPPPGTLVAFATAPGNVADDGDGQSNSLYTRSLLRHIGTPGLPLEMMFKRVRADVMRESRQRQRPWEESSLVVDYCLAGCSR